MEVRAIITAIINIAVLVSYFMADFGNTADFNRFIGVLLMLSYYKLCNIVDLLEQKR